LEQRRLSLQRGISEPLIVDTLKTRLGNF
jgi:hypothetical protein